MALGDVIRARAARHNTLITWTVWIMVGVVAATLGYVRFDQATGITNYDLSTFFLPAAQAIVAGGSPYDVHGYFYSPLVALLLAPFSDQVWVQEYWILLLILAGIAAGVLCAIAFTPRTAPAHAGVLAGFAVVTLLWSWQASLDLWLGQTEYLVMLSLAATALLTARHRPVWGTAALSIAAVIKTWPALFLVWILRRGARSRGREWMVISLVGALTALLTLAIAGPRGVIDMVTAPFVGANQPTLAALSAWGLPRVLFSSTPVATPLWESPAAQIVLTVLLVTVIVALVFLVLRHPGHDVIAMFNIVFLVVLLLPVSHYFYMMYALPTLWWWTSRVLRSPRSRLAWTAWGVLMVWWVVVFRIEPDGNGATTTTWEWVVRVVGLSLLAVTVSTIAAARDSSSREDHAPLVLPNQRM